MRISKAAVLGRILDLTTALYNYSIRVKLDVLILGYMWHMHSQITKGTVAASPLSSSDAVCICSLHACTCHCACVREATDTVVESLGDTGSVLAAAPLLLKGQTDVTLQ